MQSATLGPVLDNHESSQRTLSGSLTRLVQIKTIGRHTVRYGLVVVLLWIGAMKFTDYEAQAISGFVSNSPLMSWAYHVLSTRQFSVLIGFTELAIAALISSRPFSPKLSAVGSALTVGMFLTTLSFLFTTPGVVEPSLGFPVLTVVPGQFLIKDLVLCGAALWTLGEALGGASEFGENKSFCCA